MTPKIRNILIFAGIGVVFVLIYIFFIKRSPEAPALVSVTGSSAVGGAGVSENNAAVAEEFLALLLSVQSIKLDDSIFSDNAFNSLHDSSITLIPDVSEGGGRVNPFAPLGDDIIVPIVTTPAETITLPTLPSSTTPGAITPGSTTPGATTPGATTPGTAPKPTVPTSKPPAPVAP